MKNKTLHLIILEILTLLVYLPLLNNFFIQDEWHLFATLYAKDGNVINNILSFFVPEGAHYTPLTNVVAYLAFLLFKLNAHGYILLAILGHMACVFVFYFFSKRIIKDNTGQVIASLLFAFSYAGYQAVSWPVVSINIHFTSILALFSLYFLHRYIENRSNTNLFLTFLFLVISLLFKEIAIAFFALYLVFYFLYAKKAYDKKLFLTSVGVGIGYVIFRLILFKLSPSQAVSGFQTQSHSALAYNIFSFPFKALVQTIIPDELMWQLSIWVTKFMPLRRVGAIGTSEFYYFANFKMVEFLNYAIFGLIIYLVNKVFKYSNEESRKAVIFSLAFIFLNSFIYALSPERTGTIPLIDSRNLYFILIGSSILMSVLICGLIKSRVWMYILLIIVLGINIGLLNKKLDQLNSQARVRKNILHQIKTVYPYLPQRTLFYVESDTAYYGINDKILPFQSGFGHTLLVTYAENQKYPGQLLTKYHLWEIASQGYEEVDGQGFGFFIDKNKLLNTISERNLNSDSVIGFSWNGKEERLEDITHILREEIGETIFQ